jgi:Protein of unknown function (DUF3579)
VLTGKDKPLGPGLFVAGLERQVRSILRFCCFCVMQVPWSAGHNPSMPKPREFFIQGVTLDGKTFRPSDWAERLAGALSSYRPAPKAGAIGAHIGYSPYCIPKVIGELKCVVVDERLRDVELMAWDFVMNFAKDNNLMVVEACLLPDAPPPKAGATAAAAPVWRSAGRSNRSPAGSPV